MKAITVCNYASFRWQPGGEGILGEVRKKHEEY
jgi:hypothetical protein